MNTKRSVHMRPRCANLAVIPTTIDDRQRKQMIIGFLELNELKHKTGFLLKKLYTKCEYVQLSILMIL